MIYKILVVSLCKFDILGYNVTNEAIPIEQAKKQTKKEAATGVYLLKKMFLKISQYSQENTCVGVSS